MNLSYFRKSKHTYTDTVSHVRKETKKYGLAILGETSLPNDAGVVVHVSHPTWTGNLIAADRNLLGLLPAAIAVIRKDGSITVGGASAAVLSGITKDPAVGAVADIAGRTLTAIINAAAGAEALKPKKVKLYSTTTCPYCKAEKSWLEDKKIEHSMVLVDADQKEAEEMVNKTGQMGVPVTEIQYEDADTEFVIGFDKTRLSSLLGIA